MASKSIGTIDIYSKNSVNYRLTIHFIDQSMFNRIDWIQLTSMVQQTIHYTTPGGIQPHRRHIECKAKNIICKEIQCKVTSIQLSKYQQPNLCTTIKL